MIILSFHKNEHEASGLSTIHEAIRLIRCFGSSTGYDTRFEKELYCSIIHRFIRNFKSNFTNERKC